MHGDFDDCYGCECKNYDDYGYGYGYDSGGEGDDVPFAYIALPIPQYTGLNH